MTLETMTDTDLKVAAKRCRTEEDALDVVIEAMRRTGLKTAGEAARWLGVIVDTPDGPRNASEVRERGE